MLLLLLLLSSNNLSFFCAAVAASSAFCTLLFNSLICLLLLSSCICSICLSNEAILSLCKVELVSVAPPCPVPVPPVADAPFCVADAPFCVADAPFCVCVTVAPYTFTVVPESFSLLVFDDVLPLTLFSSFTTIKYSPFVDPVILTVFKPSGLYVLLLLSTNFKFKCIAISVNISEVLYGLFDFTVIASNTCLSSINLL